MMFERRLNPDGSTSPPGSARAASAKPSTIADTDGMSTMGRGRRNPSVATDIMENPEPRSSPAPSRKGRPRGRGRRSNRGGRSSRLHVEVESSKSRSSEKPSSANEDDEAEAEEGDASATDVYTYPNRPRQRR
jgi:MRG-binding protein